MAHKFSGTGATGTNTSVTVATGQPGGVFAITAYAPVQAGSTSQEALCELRLDGVSLDSKQVTVPGSGTSGGATIVLVGTAQATGSGVVFLTCSSADTFSDPNGNGPTVQAVQVSAGP
jgi:hypothetical protein